MSYKSPKSRRYYPELRLLRGDSLFSYGYENITTTLTYQKPELLLVFPFNYRQTIEDYFYGIGEYCDRFSIQIQGKTLTETYRVGGGGD